MDFTRPLRSVSTGGGAPAIAVELGAWLAARFDEEWAERLQRRAGALQSLSRLASATP